jgi:hypothetical protein
VADDDQGVAHHACESFFDYAGILTASRVPHKSLLICGFGLGIQAAARRILVGRTRIRDGRKERKPEAEQHYSVICRCAQFQLRSGSVSGLKRGTKKGDSDQFLNGSLSPFILKDLDTLSYFLSAKVGYRAGIHLVYGNDEEAFHEFSNAPI